MHLEAKRGVAVEAVLTGMKLAASLQSRMTSAEIMKKKDFSPVTVADFGVQALICRQLKSRFPEIPIMAEEDTVALRKDGQITFLGREVVQNVQQVAPDFDSSRIIDTIDFGRKDLGGAQRYWVLDPIDGTKGFIRGDQYVIALAYFEEGEPVLGFLGCPNFGLSLADPNRPGVLLAARRGRGAGQLAVNGNDFQLIHVSALDRLDQAVICESVEPGSSNLEKSGRLRTLLGMTRPPCRMDGQTKYGTVARGDAHLYLRMPHDPSIRENMWDHAAGTLMVEEAGGRVTDLHGRPLDFSSGHKMKNSFGVVASNGRFHDRILEGLEHPEMGIFS